jgi:hypothetical protein
MIEFRWVLQKNNGATAAMLVPYWSDCGHQHEGKKVEYRGSWAILAAGLLELSCHLFCRKRVSYNIYGYGDSFILAVRMPPL